MARESVVTSDNGAGNFAPGMRQFAPVGKNHTYFALEIGNWRSQADIAAIIEVGKITDVLIQRMMIYMKAFLHRCASRIWPARGLRRSSGSTSNAQHRQLKTADHADDYYQEEIVTVRSPMGMRSRQGLSQFVGISEATAGAQVLSMYMVVIPPGAVAKPHLHCDHESAIYVLEGQVETRYGPGLKKAVVNKLGDFVFIPPGVPHQPRNLSDTEPARAIVSRNDPNEQDSVVPYDAAVEQ